MLYPINLDIENIKITIIGGGKVAYRKATNFLDFGKKVTVISKEFVCEFDEIKDSMIVRKNGEQYVMAIQCQGVNYDLLSEQEKIGVEEGFIQLLNTLRFPIQLYIQTRSLNLRDILDEYKNKIKEIQRQIEHLDIKIKEAERRRRNSS